MPEAVADVLAIAMAKRATERYATVAEFSNDLSAALAGERNAEVTERAGALYRGAPATATAPGAAALATATGNRPAAIS